MDRDRLPFHNWFAACEFYFHVGEDKQFKTQRNNDVLCYFAWSIISFICYVNLSFQLSYIVLKKTTVLLNECSRFFSLWTWIMSRISRDT